MPRGVYRHADRDWTEHFSCAPGPSGWRYVSQIQAGDIPVGRVDLTVDSAWRCVRVVASYGGWTLRGGVVGPDAIWVRSESAEQSEHALGFTGPSPGFLVATARLLRLELFDRRRVHLVAITEPACVPLPVDQGWALVDVTTHETETEPLRVEQYEVADLATAERAVIHLAGDVVLEAPGIELVELESPPNRPIC